MFGLKSGTSVYVSVVLGWQRVSVAASLRGRNIVKAILVYCIRHGCMFISGKVWFLTSIEEKRQTLPK